MRDPFSYVAALFDVSINRASHDAYAIRFNHPVAAVFRCHLITLDSNYFVTHVWAFTHIKGTDDMVWATCDRRKP